MEAVRRLEHHLYLPHLTLILSALLFVACGVALYVTKYNIAAVISVSTVLSSFPLAISFAINTVLQGIIGGFTLRREGVIKKGVVILYNNKLMQVTEPRLRITDCRTVTGVCHIPNVTLLNSVIEVPDDQTFPPKEGTTP